MRLRKCAVFDIDATLHRGTRSGESLGECVARECIRRGLAPRHALEEADRRLQAYDRRSASYRDYINAFTSALDRGFFHGLYADDVRAIAREIAERERDRTYVFTRELLRTAQEFGYYTVAISGSFSDVVRPFAEAWGFDEVYGTEYVLAPNGTFLGTPEYVTVHAQHKGRLLKRIARRNGLTFVDSIGIGDAGSDASMLEVVQHPLLFNPNDDLLRYFEQPEACHATLVIERRVVYLADARRRSKRLAHQSLPWFVRTRLMAALAKAGVHVKFL